MRPPEPPRRPSADAPGARAPRPGLPVPKPATLGAEVIDADTFVLWCAANRADAVDAALAEGAYVGANPRTYVATRQELAAERARRLRDEDGGENNVMDAVDAAAARAPPPPGPGRLVEGSARLARGAPLRRRDGVRRVLPVRGAVLGVPPPRVRTRRRVAQA